MLVFVLCNKSPVPDMNYNVFSGTLKPTQSINHLTNPVGHIFPMGSMLDRAIDYS